MEPWWENAETWIIRDASGRVQNSTYFSRATAEGAIAEWLDRQERGGRPDISREYLEGLTVERRER